MIVGVGIDICSIVRFAAASARPGFMNRLFTMGERDPSIARMAGRFAAKEALSKALGAPTGLVWTDVEVDREEDGKPYFRLTGTVAARAEAMGIKHVHLTISHDGGLASAMVVCES